MTKIVRNTTMKVEYATGHHTVEIIHKFITKNTGIKDYCINVYNNYKDFWLKVKTQTIN